jgi:hypothetical protein
MLAGSIACIGAAILTVALTAGGAFGAGWNLTFIVAAVGVGLMAGALPLMFFGCEAREDIRANQAAPSDLLTGAALTLPAISEVTALPAMPAPAAMGTSGGASNLSSYAVLTLEHRR